MKQRHRLALLWLVVADVGLPSRVDAKLTAQIFANTCFEAESGDPAGYIVRITGNDAKPEILFAWSEGAMQPLQPASRVKWDALHKHLAFHLQSRSGDFSFSGTMSQRGLAGTLMTPFSRLPEKILLKRRSEANAGDPVKQCKNRLY